MQALVREAGCFVISWTQTEVDGLESAPINALRRGASWRWRGEPVCLNAAAGISGPLSSHAGRVIRRHAEARACEIVARALNAGGIPSSDTVHHTPAQTVTLTDGPRRWVASILDVPGLSRPLLMFLGSLPPQNTDLRVAISPERPEAFDTRNALGEGVVCFAEGTRIATPLGAALVQDIVAGDRVVTKDGGAQEVLWVGMRHISRARLQIMPDLRPVRIAAGAMDDSRPSDDLLVSPDHQMLFKSARVQDRWGEDEVLVAARDLVGRPGVSRVSAEQSVTYYHVMLAEHGILLANGVETESFHPGATQLGAIAEEQRSRLIDVMPELASQAANYGPTARRVLCGVDAVQIARIS